MDHLKKSLPIKTFSDLLTIKFFSFKRVVYSNCRKKILKKYIVNKYRRQALLREYDFFPLETSLINFEKKKKKRH